ncbi:hypothetical protein SLS62_010887 [Diatrype stigma]|uniref:Uncharacterized protein n=1 Tax=Diatrype stigma TaxID=117547 RepID=A0AAN9YFY7_9PEZI
MADGTPHTPTSPNASPIPIREAPKDNTDKHLQIEEPQAPPRRAQQLLEVQSVRPRPSRPVAQLVREYCQPRVPENPESKPVGTKGGFSVLLVALYLQQVSKLQNSELNRPGIFLYRTQGGDSGGRDDKEKNALNSPQSWLPDIVASRLVEFRLDLRNGTSEFEKAAFHVRKRVGDILAETMSITSIVFFTHGYGSVVLQQVISEPVAFSASVAAVVTFANPLLSPGATEVVREWTKLELGKSQKGETFQDPEMGQAKDIRLLLSEYTVLMQDCWERPWERPLPNEPFNDRSRKTDLTTIAQVARGKDSDFQNTCSMVQSAIADHRMFMVARSSDVGIMKKLIEETDCNIKAVTYQRHNVLQLAVRAKCPAMVNMLLDYRESKRFIKQRDRRGDTALHIAIDSIEEGEPNNAPIYSIVKTLFERGASRVRKNYKGVTPMDMASRIEYVKNIINRPQRIGRLFVPVLSKGKPLGDKGQEACVKTEITITNISKIGDEQVDIEPEEVVNVQKLLYSGEEFSKLVGIPRETGALACQWFHIPANNVR